MSETIVVRVHPNDPFARIAVKHVLDKSHNRRFKSEVLDFYRNGYSEVVNNLNGLDDVLFLVAVCDDVPVGMSSCLLLNSQKRIRHSLTVVSDASRKSGIGKKLLASKINFLTCYYPHLSIRSYVNKANEGGVRLCNSVGLRVIKSGSKDGLRKVEYYIYGV